jgi:hypothetical protein
VQAKKAKEAADRWTDGVWAVKAYLIKKYNKTPQEVDRMMGARYCGPLVAQTRRCSQCRLNRWL